MPEFRDRLKTVRDGLLQLHKSLLDSERAVYERDVAKIRSSNQFLSLLLEDPFFQPLRELSQFIVVIDEAFARKDPPLSSEEADQFLKQARAMLTPAEGGTGFARRYFEIMQRDPATVLAHRDMLQVIAGH